MFERNSEHTQGRDIITHKCSILTSFCCSTMVTLWPGGFVKVSDDFPGSHRKLPKSSDRGTAISRNVQYGSFERAQIITRSY